MSHIPTELKYTKTHEWIRAEDDGSITIGITDHAQDLLGDLVFVDIPEIHIEVQAGEEAGVVESVKAASDIYSPISGEIISVNEKLTDEPALINQDPYGDGWIFRLQPNDLEDLRDLLDAEEYEQTIEKEE